MVLKFQKRAGQKNMTLFQRKNINRYFYRLCLIAIYTFLLAPILIIVVVSFDSSPNFMFPPKGLSLRWFVSFFTNKTFMDSFFKVSLPVAIVVAVVAVPFGVLGAIALVRHSFRGKAFVETFFTLPMLVPQVLLGISLLLFFIQLNMKATFFSLIAGHVVIALPYVVRTVSASLYGVNEMLEEAARMLGANRIQTFFRVTLPLIRSGIISGALFSFIISFGDINLALFITGPRTVTVPVHIFSEIQWQGDPTIAAISTVQIIIIGMILAFVNKVFRIRMAL
jgi:putative spermidine/putrescine transport system permease protein